MSEPTPSFGQSDIVKLSDEDTTVALLERAVTGLWEVVNELTRLRRTSRQNYRVTIFGSARLKPDTLAYGGVKQLAAELTKMGCDIISGGGPGIMQAANEGALSVDPKGLGRSVGINIELPFEQEVNPFVTQAFTHRTFFSRLHHFMIASDAFIVTPGGIGSLLGTAPNSGGSGLMGLFHQWSDRRLKEDIAQVGTLFDGTPVYGYRYKGAPAYHIGLMAQDVEVTTPHAVIEINGSKAVDYRAATEASRRIGVDG